MKSLLPENITNKRILFSPLNWGMGHVSRSIGLINILLENSNRIFIACEVDQRKIYEEYFNDVEFIHHKGYPFKFNGKGKFSQDLFLSAKHLFKRLKEEKNDVNDYVKKYHIDLVISDHRYGFYYEEIPSIFITHQYNLPLKWYHKVVQIIHHRLINKFKIIWVMDFLDHSLAGKLSLTKNKNVVFIGPFSRFMLYDIPVEKNNQTVFIASGPLSYAIEFVNEIYAQNKDADSYLIAPHSIFSKKKLTWREQDEIILKAKKIVSRSGYSTIMDVHFLQCSSHLLPTKGQLEQEYLARLHAKNDRITF